MTGPKPVALPLGYSPTIKKVYNGYYTQFSYSYAQMVEGVGFEPTNPMGTDLQSVAFSLFAIPPSSTIVN